MAINRPVPGSGPVSVTFGPFFRRADGVFCSFVSLAGALARGLAQAFARALIRVLARGFDRAFDHILNRGRHAA